MGSDEKEIKPINELTNAQLAKTRGLLPDKYDLDKNPIKFRQHDGSLSEEAHDKDYMELTLRSGKHSDLVKKLMRQRIEKRAQDFPRWPGSLSTGVRVMWIESRFWYDRERLLPDFDNDWRTYRAKYLHSLELDPREPIHVPEYERYLINPIRRFYQKPGDFIEEKIVKRFFKNPLHSAMGRITITRGFMTYLVLMATFYWIRFNGPNWEKMRGPSIDASAPIIYPGHPDYPFKDYKTEPAHHYDIGFTRRKVYRDLRDYEDPTVIL